MKHYQFKFVEPGTPGDEWLCESEGCVGRGQTAEEAQASCLRLLGMRQLELLKAPFPYFGGKSKVVDEVWQRFGRPKQYIEPFCGSAAILLGAPQIAPLEVVGDWNGFIANFWRAVTHQGDEVARWADYPVSHIDLGARHVWLMDQRPALADALQDANWPGDAKVAGWWLWGQCAWIGSGWCDWGKIPHVGNAGQGVQARGKIPHVGDAGQGVVNQIRRLSQRLARVRVIHGDWTRCLNHHYGKGNTAVFLDPPYAKFEGVYGTDSVSAAVGKWCRENEHLRIALCGFRGEHEMPGWSEHAWKRDRPTYSSAKTTALEVIWFSPACDPG